MEQVYIPYWIAFGVGTKSRRDSVVDTDLQIREGSHPDPEIRERSQKTFFSALRASVWSKNKGAAPRSPPPWIPLRLKNSFKEDPTSKFCAPYYVFVPPISPSEPPPSTVFLGLSRLMHSGGVTETKCWENSLGPRHYWCPSQRQIKEEPKARVCQLL